MGYFKSVLFLLSFLSATVIAEPAQVWNLDTSHSSVNFAVDHMVISETTGKFDKYTLDVKADKPDFSDVKVKVVIQTASVNTADAKRDEHLKGADFFNVEKNPTITFESTSFDMIKGKKGVTRKLKGNFTMNGVTKPLTLDVKFNGMVQDPWDKTKTRAGLKVTGVINREDYGLKYNSILAAGGVAIGKEVRITVNVELIK